MIEQQDLFEAPRCSTCRRPSRELAEGVCKSCRATVRGRSTGPALSLNDHYIAYYARLFLVQHGRFWPEAFETRHLHGDPAKETAWRQFHEEHPEVWRGFRYIALQALQAPGVKGRISARMVWELLRFKLSVRVALDLGEELDRAMAEPLAAAGQPWSGRGGVADYAGH